MKAVAFVAFLQQRNAVLPTKLFIETPSYGSDFVFETKKSEISIFIFILKYTTKKFEQVSANTAHRYMKMTNRTLKPDLKPILGHFLLLVMVK